MTFYFFLLGLGFPPFLEVSTIFFPDASLFLFHRDHLPRAKRSVCTFSLCFRHFSLPHSRGSNFALRPASVFSYRYPPVVSRRGTLFFCHITSGSPTFPKFPSLTPHPSLSSDVLFDSGMTRLLSSLGANMDMFSSPHGDCPPSTKISIFPLFLISL